MNKKQHSAPKPENPGGNARVTAYRSIRNKIILLELKPGEALSDKLLAEELGMSRTPVREALLILSVANMVVLRPQVGTFVAPIDAQLAEAEQFSRLALEKEALRRACGHLDAAWITQYTQNLRAHAQLTSNPAPGQVEELLRLDNVFHGFAFEATGNAGSYVLLQRHMHHIERLRALSLMLEDGRCLTEDHERIAAALTGGNEDAALAELEHHLTRYRDSLLHVREQFPEYFKIG